jgi:hypothetical protein
VNLEEVGELGVQPPRGADLAELLESSVTIPLAALSDASTFSKVNDSFWPKPSGSSKP